MEWECEGPEVRKPVSLLSLQQWMEKMGSQVTLMPVHMEKTGLRDFVCFVDHM